MAGLKEAVKSEQRDFSGSAFKLIDCFFFLFWGVGWGGGWNGKAGTGCFFHVVGQKGQQAGQSILSGSGQPSQALSASL